MLYDGSCPLCAREVRFLRSLRRASSVRFTDIASPSVDPAALRGRPLDALLAEMHCVDMRSGQVLTRVPAFRALYAALLGVDVLWFTQFWPISAAASAAYGWVAANKHRLAPFLAAPEPPPGGSQLRELGGGLK